MNEEEFKEILVNLGYKFDINKREEEFCLLCIKKGFQKGKLEVIDKLKKKFKSNITVISKREFLNELEQLQKEIGEEKGK